MLRIRFRNDTFATWAEFSQFIWNEYKIEATEDEPKNQVEVNKALYELARMIKEGP